MKVPTVHLNGTSVDDLYSQAHEAHKALRVALEKLYAMAPNARDYYVQGEGAFEVARKEHQARIDALIFVQKELVTIAAALLDHRMEQKARREGRVQP